MSVCIGHGVRKRRAIKAIRVHISGEDRRLQMEEVPRPGPRPDQVLIRALHIGVNRADFGRGATGGSVANEPFISGLDVGGTIEEVGSDVTGWKQGDPVIALVPTPCLFPSARSWPIALLKV